MRLPTAAAVVTWPGPGRGSALSDSQRRGRHSRGGGEHGGRRGSGHAGLGSRASFTGRALAFSWIGSCLAGQRSAAGAADGGAAGAIDRGCPARSVRACPGSDLTGQASAALAASSIVFKSSDPKYSTQLLSQAESLYSFANSYRGNYASCITSAANYDNSYSGYWSQPVAQRSGCTRRPARLTQNQVWCEIVALACDLLAWTQMLALTGEARRWEPKRLRLRLFTCAGRASSAAAAASSSVSPPAGPGPARSPARSAACTPSSLADQHQPPDDKEGQPRACGTPPTRRDSRVTSYGHR